MGTERKWKGLMVTAAVLAAATSGASHAALPGGTLDPTTVPKYTQALTVPDVMPKTAILSEGVEYYEIAVRQFRQQILPPGFRPTTVWGYGSLKDEVFTYPARTIEATVDRPVRVKWVNELKDSDGNYLSHLFAVDQTLHWANPPQDCLDGTRHTDCRGGSQAPYAGPVPLVTHLHGAHVGPDSDGYPEAWYLPNAGNIPGGYAKKGSHFGQVGGVTEEDGAAVYQYPNDQRATTLWYHDHVLGMTRTNVYAGLAGFYLLRGGTSDANGLPKERYEVPLLIQDKSFNADGSLFFPDNRAFFEGLSVPDLRIPFIPEPAFRGPSDISPIWNPEFFGNTMVVNGKTWPTLFVERRRYRFRIVNGSDTRVLILKVVAGDPTVRPGISTVPFWQVGADGGFLPEPVKVQELLIAPAERVDVVVDFGGFPDGTELYLINEGPDEPFGGGRAPGDFAFADPETTGQVMKFQVKPTTPFDQSTPAQSMVLPPALRLGPVEKVRTLSLNEAESATVFVVANPDGSVEAVNPRRNRDAGPFAPAEALLGTASVSRSGVIAPTPLEWMEPITENPGLNSTELWEIYDFTEDAHPIHIHQVQFEVVNRQDISIDPATGRARLVPGTVTGPEVGETGTKDTVLVYPSRVTRVKARFDIPGLFVWHCHILSHEDNEMMRPLCVGNLANCPTSPR